MRIAGMPFVEEGLRTYASHRAILRTYLLIPGALSVALLVAWPQGTAQSVFRGSATTDPFSVAAVTLLFFLLYLGGRYGAEDYSPDTLVNLRDYVTLTSASVASLVSGKAVFATLHTVFLLALGAPFLLAACAVSGAPAGSFVASLSVLGSAALAARMYGLFLLAAFGQRPLLRLVSLVSSIGAFLIGTYLLLPALNPVSVLLSTLARPAPRDTALLVIFDLVVAFLLTAAVTLVLMLARRAARRGAGTALRGDGESG